MNPHLPDLIWLQLLALLAVEVGLVALAFRLLRGWSASAAWRRTFCQAAITGVLALTLCELSGAGRKMAGWVMPSGSGRIPGHDAQSGIRSDSQSESTTPLRLREEFLSEVETRLQHSASRLPSAAGSKAPAPPATTITVPQLSRVSIKPVHQSLLANYPVPETFSDSIVLWVAVVWASGVVILAARACLARLLFMIFSFRRRAVSDAAVLRRVHVLVQQLKISRRVRILESARLTSPIAFGVLRPSIGLPAEFGRRFDAEKQDVMLAHELAHVAAHDPFWCLLSDLMTVILWWHPAVWWLRRQLHLASELAADEASLLLTAGPQALAQCLVELGALLTRPAALGQLPMAGFRSHLGCRVQRLLHLQGRWSPPDRVQAALARTFGPVAMVAVVLLCSAWAVPQVFTKGESMKLMQLNWKRSLAAFALFASIHGPKEAAGLDSQTGSASALALSPQTLPLLKPAAPGSSDPNAAANEAFRARYGLAPAIHSTRADTEPPPTQPVLKPAAAPSPSEAEEADAFRMRYGLAPARRTEELQAAQAELQQLLTQYTDKNPIVAAKAEQINRLRAQLPSPKSGTALETKLKNMLLSEVQFDGLPLNEVLHNLSDQSVKLDPEKRGINFLINPNPPPNLAAPAPIDPTTGLPAALAASEPIDVSAVAIKFNLPLRNVTMEDVLNAIVKVADRPVQYALENYAVVFSLSPEAFLAPASSPSTSSRPEQLEVRTFKVNANTFVAGLESAFGIKLDLSNDAGGRDRSQKVLAALKELMVQLGIPLEGKKSAFYNELTGVLMVRATPAELEVVHAAIQTLSGLDSEQAAAALTSSFGGIGSPERK